jgi:hypothetical protein
MCELAHCRAGAERLKSVSPLFLRVFLDADVAIRLLSTNRLWYDLAQDSQSLLSPDYPKKFKPSSSLLMAPS